MNTSFSETAALYKMIDNIVLSTSIENQQLELEPSFLIPIICCSLSPSLSLSLSLYLLLFYFSSL